MHYQGWAKAAGVATSGRVETGAVTGVHRAGGSLNVHVHFHLLCLDGVYVDDGETLRFEPAPAPTRAELTSLLQRIHVRVMKWLARRGLLRHPDDADTSNDPPEVSPAEALATAGMQRGTLLTVRQSSPSVDLKSRWGAGIYEARRSWSASITGWDFATSGMTAV